MDGWMDKAGLEKITREEYTLDWSQSKVFSCKSCCLGWFKCV